MERYQPGSDIDLCLDLAIEQRMSHSDRLRLMAAIDDLLLAWSVDLSLRHETPQSSMLTCSGWGAASGGKTPRSKTCHIRAHSACVMHAD